MVVSRAEFMEVDVLAKLLLGESLTMLFAAALIVAGIIAVGGEVDNHDCHSLQMRAYRRICIPILKRSTGG